MVAVFSPIAAIGLVAAALTGFATAMLWPGSLILAEKRIPVTGVFVYAMMASGGDLGASVVPQLLGIVTDKVAASEFAKNLATTLSLTAEQIGMRAGMLIAAICPIIAIFVFLYILKTKDGKDEKNEN